MLDNKQGPSMQKIAENPKAQKKVNRKTRKYNARNKQMVIGEAPIEDTR